jgi:heat shock protein HtpX
MALEKLQHHERPLQRQNPSTEHLFFANPLKQDGFLAHLFSTHPPMEKRIARLRNFVSENAKEM